MPDELIEEAKRLSEAWTAISELAWVSYEGDPWYAEHEGIDAGRVNELEQEAKLILARLPELVERLERAEKEARFVAECLRWSSSIRTGVSSKALIAFALDGKPPNPMEFPHDKGDLGRCEGVYEIAPPSLQERMLPMLKEFRAALDNQAEGER